MGVLFKCENWDQVGPLFSKLQLFDTLCDMKIVIIITKPYLVEYSKKKQKSNQNSYKTQFQSQL
jgi:hypothetical protein